MSRAIKQIIPTQAQLAMADAAARHRGVVVTKGRRAGFTTFCIWYAIDVMRAYPNRNALWVDDTMSSINEYIDTIAVPYMEHKRIRFTRSRVAPMISLRNGSRIVFRTENQGASLEGKKYDMIIVNEAGNLLRNPDNHLLNISIMPMMMDNPQSRIIIGGVPRGGTSSGFYKLYRQAENDTTGFWKALKFSSYDNPIIAPNVKDTYEAHIEEVEQRQEIYGDFVNLNGRPFIFQFDPARHVGDAPYRGGFIKLSFDFNVDPITCLVFDGQSDKVGVVMDEFRLRNSDVYALCDAIKQRYDTAKIISVTGDASGQSRSALTRGSLTYYAIILNELGLSRRVLKLATVNPNVANSRAFTNAMFRNDEILIDRRCVGLIEDVQLVQTDSDGGMDKSNAGRTHLLDCLRYYLHAFGGNNYRSVARAGGFEMPR